MATFYLEDKTYWDCENEEELHAITFADVTRSAVSLRIAGIRRLLQDSARFKDSSQFYEPGSVNEKLQAAFQSLVFKGLLFTEQQTIDHATKAAVTLAKYRASAGSDPKQAMQAVEEFGSRITEAFNGGLGTLIDNLREFSGMIFLEAARALDPSLIEVHPITRLDTILLRSSAPKSASDAFLKGTAPSPTQIAIEQPIMGLP